MTHITERARGKPSRTYLFAGGALSLALITTALTPDADEAATPRPSAASSSSVDASSQEIVDAAHRAVVAFADDEYAREIDKLVSPPPVPPEALALHSATADDLRVLEHIAQDCKEELELAAHAVMADILVAMDEDWKAERYVVRATDEPAPPRRTGGLFVRHSTSTYGDRKVHYSFASAEHPQIEAALQTLRERRTEAAQQQAAYVRALPAPQ